MSLPSLQRERTYRSYGRYQPKDHKPAIDGVQQRPAPVTDAKGTSAVEDVYLIKRTPFALFLYCLAIADVVDPLEGRDNFLVVGHYDDGGLRLTGHVVEDADHG